MSALRIEIVDFLEDYFSKDEFSKIVNGQSIIPNHLFIYLAKVVEQHCLVNSKFYKNRVYERSLQMEEYLDTYCLHPAEQWRYDKIFNSELKLGKLIKKHIDTNPDDAWCFFKVTRSKVDLVLEYNDDYRIWCFENNQLRPEDMDIDGYNFNTLFKVEEDEPFVDLCTFVLPERKKEEVEIETSPDYVNLTEVETTIEVLTETSSYNFKVKYKDSKSVLKLTLGYDIYTLPDLEYGDIIQITSGKVVVVRRDEVGFYASGILNVVDGSYHLATITS